MNLTVLALAGSAPIAVVLVLMAGLRWPALKAMGAGWLVAGAVGLGVWRLEGIWWAASALYGALQAIEIVVIVFGALLLMNHLQRSGAMHAIRGHFSGISGDRRIQLLLVGLGFMTIIEGAAGFGTPGALAAPLLIGLGFPPLAAAVFGLFFNALQPPFGAAGTPILGGIGAVIGEGTLQGGMEQAAFLSAVSGWTAVFTGGALVLWGMIGVFLFLFWFGRDEDRSLAGAWRATWPVVPFAGLLGGVAGGTQLLVAWFFGPELPNIAAGFAVLGCGVLAARKGFFVPRETWDFPSQKRWPEPWFGGIRDQEPPGAQGRPGMSVGLAWTPYLLVALVLIVTRWPGLGIAGWLRSFSLDIDRILGRELHYSLRYLHLPGIVPFLPVAILAWWLQRMPAKAVREAWGKTLRQILVPGATLVVAVSMSQVIIQSGRNPLDQPGMLQALSQWLAWAAGETIPLLAPWIGALGSFITGSTTSSNILFGALQHDAAGGVGVSRTLIVALQNTGAGLGNMVSILNIAAICGVAGMAGREGELLRKAILPTLLFTALAGLAGALVVRLAPGLY